MINQPSHAEAVQLLVEEVDPELASQERHVLYDGQSDPPLGVLRQLHYSGQQRLAQLLDADDLVDTVEVGDDVQPHVGALVLQLREEEWKKVLNGVVLAEDGRQAHDHAGQGRLGRGRNVIIKTLESSKERGFLNRSRCCPSP